MGAQAAGRQSSKTSLKGIGGQPAGPPAPYATYSSTVYDFSRQQVLPGVHSGGAMQATKAGTQRRDGAKKRPSTTMGMLSSDLEDGPPGHGRHGAANMLAANTTAPSGLSG